MEDIRFDTGIVEFNLNDAIKVYFNPTDSAFVERILIRLTNWTRSRKHTRLRSTSAQTRKKSSRLRGAEMRKCEKWSMAFSISRYAVRFSAA